MCHERNEAMIAPLRQEGAIGPHEIANPADKDARHGFIHSLYGRNNACSTAQGGGGSFKDRKRIGEVCWCESWMAERTHWWIERSLACRAIYLPIYLSVYLSVFLSVCLFIFHVYLSDYLSIYLFFYLPIYLFFYLSMCFSICLFVFLSIHLFFNLSTVMFAAN